MAPIVEVRVNFGDAGEAAAVSRDAVEKRLAACANISGPIRSVYWWDGAIQAEEETAVVFKTSDAAVDDLVDFIAKRHSYQVPGIVIHGPLRTTRPYLDWVERETRRTA